MVSYNHDLLKLRLANIHNDWLFQYKLQTEKTIDDQRKQGTPLTHPHCHCLCHPPKLRVLIAPLLSAVEFIRGHSLHIPGFSLSNFPIRRVWSTLLTANPSSTAEEDAADEQKAAADVRAATAHRPTAAVVRRRSDAMLGASHHLFCSDEERRILRQDEAAERQQRLTRKRERQSRWKAEIDSALSVLTQPSPPLPSQRLASALSPAIEDGEEQRSEAASPAPPRAASSSPSSDGGPLQSGRSPSPASSGRGGGAAGGSSSPYPVPSVGASASGANAVPALCEECGCRVDSQWSVCDFCGFDPLEGDDEEEEGGRRRRKKRAQRMQNLMAAQHTNEKKAKAVEEMRILAETMSPWESVEAT